MEYSYVDQTDYQTWGRVIHHDPGYYFSLVGDLDQQWEYLNYEDDNELDLHRFDANRVETKAEGGLLPSEAATYFQ